MGNTYNYKFLVLFLLLKWIILASVEDIQLQRRSEVLMEVGLRYLDYKVCKDGYSGTAYAPFLTDKMLCAGRIDGGFDTCSVSVNRYTVIVIFNL